MQYAKPVTLNVEECDRLSFLPYLFGQDFLYAEASVYALAKQMMPEYEGGFWHFIRLPDGGGYMMPDGDRFHLVNGENWFDRTVSADAAGIQPGTGKKQVFPAPGVSVIKNGKWWSQSKCRNHLYPNFI
ncbi:antirestriction protein [Escherichia coli]|uniref:antirestriction protein n=1 Tax=Escherichia coli TaxID=562 RepID=UPI003877A02A